MRRILGSFIGRKRCSIIRDESGVAAVEFALISAGMFMLLSAAVDMTQMITIDRDLDRVTAEAAQVVAACPDIACRRDVFLGLQSHVANIAPQLATMRITGAYFGRKGNLITNMEGPMTDLQVEKVNLKPKALAVLQDGDKGVAIYASYTHRPIILGFAQKWGFTTMNFASDVVTLTSRSSS